MTMTLRLGRLIMEENKFCTKDLESVEKLREWTTLLFVAGREVFLDATSHLPTDDFCFVLNDMHHLMDEEIVHLLAMRKEQDKEAANG